jgi:hypothetical protein
VNESDTWPDASVRLKTALMISPSGSVDPEASKVIVRPT